MVKRWNWAAALAVTLAASRCGYAPKLADCVVRCAAPDNSCPDGLTCSNGVCGRGTCQANWMPASTGLEAGWAYAVAVDPKHPTTVYVGTNNGVWKRTSNSAPWTVSSKGLPREGVGSLAIDPVNTTTLYAGISGAGIYRSTDAGANWAAASSGPAELPSDTIMQLAVDPSHPDHLYALGFDNNTIYRSTDGGTYWTPLPGATVETNWSSLAVHPSNGSLYVTSSLGGLYVIPFEGVAWTRVATSVLGDNLFLKAVAFDAPDPLNQRLCVAGDTGALYCGSDSGTAWAQVAQGPKYIRLLAADVMAGKTRWLAASDDSDQPGLYTFADGTANQMFSIVPAVTNMVVALAADPNNSGTAYAGTLGPGGLYKTPDGASWVLDVSGLTGPVTALAIDPKTPTKLYASLLFSPIFISTDGAESWSASPQAGGFVSLAVDQTDPNLVWAGGLGAAESTDGGATWVDGQAPPGQVVNVILSSPTTRGRFYAGTSNGVFTTDSRSGWMPASTGLPANANVNTLAASPYKDDGVWAGVSGAGVYESKDGSLAMWSPINGGLLSLDVSALLADPGYGALLYAGTSHDGVWKTTDEKTWNALAPNLDAVADVSALAISNPLTGSRTLYLGTPENGVFRSLDSGQTWFDYSAGLGSKRITCLVVDPTNPDIVYAGTYDGGVFKAAPQR